MRRAYLVALRVAAASADEPAFVAESPMYDSAKGQTTIIIMRFSSFLFRLWCNFWGHLSVCLFVIW